MATGERWRAERRRGTRLDPEARRAQIVDAACELLASQGVEAMAIEDVADAAGVSRSLVYTYFGDRDSLVAEIYMRVLDRIDAYVPDDVPDGIPVDRDAVIGRTIGYLRYAQAHPSEWRLLVTDSVRRHPLVAEARAARIARITDGVSGAEAPLVADAAWGLLEAGVMHWVERPDLPIETAADMLATTLWSGLAEIRGYGDAHGKSSRTRD